LPKTARPIVRSLQGDYLIVRHTSDYLKISEFYSGIHDKMSSNEFKTLILRLFLKYDLQKKRGLIKNEHKIKFSAPEKYKTFEKKLSYKERMLVETVIDLAKNRNQEEETLKKKYGISELIFPSRDDKQEKYLMADRPEEKKLEKFLRKLNKNEIALIAAVMYGGREFRPPFRAEPLEELIDYLIKDRFLIEMIIEKAPLDKYLEEGIKAYS